jgi:hypothetical protein
MTGLFILAACGLWTWLVFRFCRWVGTHITRGRWRWSTVVALFVALVPLPLADEIAGKFQFEKECRTRAVLIVDAERVRGKTLRRVATQSHLTGGPLDIEQWDNRFVDPQTGEVLASYRWLRVSGGVISRMFLDSGKPISFSPSTCAPPIGEPIEERYGFALTSN